MLSNQIGFNYIFNFKDSSLQQSAQVLPDNPF